MTDPSKYCRDIDQYEKALVNAIDKLQQMEVDGYIGSVIRNTVWYPLIEGLYKVKHP